MTAKLASRFYFGKIRFIHESLPMIEAF